MEKLEERHGIEGYQTMEERDDKISMLSDDQIERLEKTIDMMLTPNKE